MRSSSVMGSLICCIVIGVSHASPSQSRWKDGTIEFAKAETKGIALWTIEERQAAIDADKPVMDTVPSASDLNLSTAPISSFESYQDWLNAHTKRGLLHKMEELDDAIQVRLKIGDDGSLLDYQQRYSWLKLYWGTLQQ